MDTGIPGQARIRVQRLVANQDALRRIGSKESSIRDVRRDADRFSLRSYVRELDVCGLSGIFGNHNRSRDTGKALEFRSEPVFARINFEGEVTLKVGSNFAPGGVSPPLNADGCADHYTALRVRHNPRQSRRRKRKRRAEDAE